MTDAPDAALLAQFARNRSETAFAALVDRHLALVHSTALRHTANPQHAQDISQAVFIILARKAGTLGRKTVLPGWLYHTARLTAANFQRMEARRARREQEAFMQSTLDDTGWERRNETDAEHWRELSPQLDAAMAHLGDTDLDALVLRYFQNKSLTEVGAALGVAERAAQKRVSRALEKLRRFFGRRGIALSAAAIAGALSANSVQAAPAVLANTITAVAVTKGAAAGTSTLSLIKGALKIMAWTKAKTAVVVAASVLLAAGTATVTLKTIQDHRSWRYDGFDSQLLDRQPPQVAILPSKFRGDAHGYGNDGKMMGTGASAQTVVSVAYGFSTPARTILSAALPSTRFDFIASLPAGNNQALQREVKKTFGVVAKIETRPADVLLLKVKSPNVPGLKPATDFSQDWESWGYDHYRSHNKPLGHLSSVLEWASKIPVVDATGLTKGFDLQLKWDQRGLETPNVEAMNQALQDQLGLELVPTNMPIEMLVVENAK